MNGENQLMAIVLRLVDGIWNGGSLDLGDDNISTNTGGR
jgi:hypothetical protein